MGKANVSVKFDDSYLFSLQVIISEVWWLMIILL